ncbi:MULTISPECIES: SDR family NAD(P)-dependent oxidoreductase [Achromobacter]|uniref:SDR family NAD(P)-dependent oxidoreductase n=1 Tax=Achromobacter spanius TaxID=217203 RepID=A0ABY8GW32_9BURK|nr:MULTISPECIES: SDR family NAD(P)-dependent oxidoreductase [Achromobacter]WAI82015.1 SDR family oxidoreductase [Achromobacter spanius]WEX92104.1 SDR family oxidoreductase [Achromobacter sp. SS2-2022]WFP08748.1 SDR family NAD(P)-dependent oxidoreductase [Achromobacter spanius]
MTTTSAPVLDGKIVIVTGAAGGLGQAIAKHCLDAGARVALLDRDADMLAQCCRTFAVAPSRILALSCDVADVSASRSAVEQVATHWGSIDKLVNNAATVTPGVKVADLTPEQWRLALDVNLTGAWLMSKWAIAHMARAGGGVVLNIASQLGSVAAPGRGAYSASKAGLIALARAIAVDHAADGIRALSLSPGAVLTSRLVDRYGSAQEANAALATKYPVGRLGTAEEVAQTTVFLISEAASFITGTDIRADGGYTAQ